MLIIEGITKSKIKTTLFTTTKLFIIDNKEHSVKILLNDKETLEITVKELFKKYSYIDKILFKTYENGVLIKNPIVYVRKSED